MKTVIKNVIYQNKNVDVLIDDEKIVNIGNLVEDDCDEIIDGEGYYLHNGMINGYFNGIIDDVKKLLSQGITSVFDFSFDIDVTRYLIDCGIRVFKAIGDADGNIEINEDYLEKEIAIYKNLNVEDIILYLPSPNISTEEEYSTLIKYAKKYGYLIATSVSENLDDVGEIDKEYNCSPIELLESYGFLDFKNMLIDCVYVDKDEVNILKNYDTTICTCPTKNLVSGSGIAPVYSFVKNDLNIIVGGNTNNIFGELSLVKNLQSGILNEKNIIKNDEILSISNKNFNKVFEKIGGILIGNCADFILTDEKEILACTPLNIKKVFIKGKLLYDK